MTEEVKYCISCRWYQNFGCTLGFRCNGQIHWEAMPPETITSNNTEDPKIVVVFKSKEEFIEFTRNLMK
jgi:hypothetical protein